MNDYQATVTREGKWWMISVPAVDGLTQARRLSDVEAMARSLIAVSLGVPSDSFTVTVHHELPDVIAKHLQRAHELREEAAHIQSEAAAETRAAAAGMVSEGWPLRDAGALLGVSFQRVHQLVQATPPASRSAGNRPTPSSASSSPSPSSASYAPQSAKSAPA